MSDPAILAGLAAELVSVPGLAVLVPLLAAVGLCFVADRRHAAWIGIAAAAAAFLLACALPWQRRAGLLLLVDPLSATFAILTGFVGLLAAWSSALQGACGQRGGAVVLQCCLGCLLLALLSNNAAATWGGIEAAGLAASLAVALPGTPAARAAAWGQVLTGGAGLLLAGVGTVLLYLAATPVLGDGLPALRWDGLAAAARFSPALLNLAFVFLLLGYAARAGLAPLELAPPGLAPLGPAPLQAGLAQAGPLPATALLAAAIPGVALSVILRLRDLLNANAEALAPGPPLLAFGLASVLLAGFGLWRRGDAVQAVAVAAIGQTGVAAFAFGLGGAAATFAGLLQLILLTLTRVAVLHCLGFALRRTGGPGFAGLRGRHRALGLTLAAGLVALAGLPPFGLFPSIFLVLGETVRRLPGLAPPLALGLACGAWALARRLASPGPGAANPDHGAAPSLPALLPAWLPLAAVVVLGVAMPAAVAGWLAAIAGAGP